MFYLAIGGAYYAIALIQLTKGDWGWALYWVALGSFMLWLDLNGRRSRARTQQMQIRWEEQNVEQLPADAALDALRRADGLVQHILGPHDYEFLLAHGYIDVPSKRYAPGSVYRIKRDAQHGVVLYQDNHLVFSLCVLVPYPEFPQDDQFITLYMIAKYREYDLLNVGRMH